jgi:hypothetical protein
MTHDDATRTGILPSSPRGPGLYIGMRCGRCSSDCGALPGKRHPLYGAMCPACHASLAAKRAAKAAAGAAPAG